MKWRIHVAADTWLFVNSLIMILCNNKYNSFSTISRHKDDLLKEDDTRMNTWMLEMNDKFFLDLRSISSKELQRLEYKRFELTSRSDSSEELRKLEMKYFLDLWSDSSEEPIKLEKLTSIVDLRRSPKNLSIKRSKQYNCCHWIQEGP